jgi:hypothetical protein
MDYNVTHDCDYKLFLNDDAFEEGETDEEKECIRTALYQRDFLRIFNMTTFDDDVANNKLRELFTIITKSDEISWCMKEIAKKSIYQNEEIGLMMLYSFDYMYLSHLCISEYIKNGFISEANLNLLTFNINKAIQ